MTEFQEKWLETVKRKNSVLCAGLDPAEFEMGRGEKGLPQFADKKEWSFRYIDAVSPFASVVKPNIQYWVNAYLDDDAKRDDMKALVEIGEFARDQGLLYVLDAKLADIGSTNDAGIYHHAKKGFDAVTVAPYAGNIEEIGKQARDRGIGAITMCIMSNPEYEREKSMLVPLEESESGDFLPEDVVEVEGILYTKRYKYLANKSEASGLDGIVMGAPSKKNHIQESELEKARYYAGEDMLVLLPGLGHQKGEANLIWNYFGSKNVIVNDARRMMFPNGPNSTPVQQAERATKTNEELNVLRAA